MESVLKGRSDPNNYSFFFDIFVPLLEKKSTFNEKVMTATKDEEPFISSETFGLLVLENHWNRWLDIHRKYGSKIKIQGTRKRIQICSQSIPGRIKKQSGQKYWDWER